MDLRDDENKFRFWNTAPEDPIERGRVVNIAHYSRATKGVLFHQSHMPVGEHRGKIMERVPAEYLLWVHRQPWAPTSGNWRPVWDYVERHRAEIEERAELARREQTMNNGQ